MGCLPLDCGDEKHALHGCEGPGDGLAAEWDGLQTMKSRICSLPNAHPHPDISPSYSPLSRTKEKNPTLNPNLP